LKTGVIFSRSQVLNTFPDAIEAVCLQLQSTWQRVSCPVEVERLSIGTHLPLADISEIRVRNIAGIPPRAIGLPATLAISPDSMVYEGGGVTVAADVSQFV